MFLYNWEGGSGWTTRKPFQAEGRTCTGENGVRKKPEGKLELQGQQGEQSDFRVETEGMQRAKKVLGVLFLKLKKVTKNFFHL